MERQDATTEGGYDRTESDADIAEPPIEDIVERGIRQWRETRPDIDSSAKGVVGRILRLQGVIVRTVDTALQPYGVKYTTYAVLATLRVSPPPHTMSPTQLRETLLFTSGGISNLLRKVEAGGWIEREGNPRDGRGVVVRLTPAGKALADRTMAAHAAAEHALIRMLSPAERRDMAALLSRMLVHAPVP